MTGGPAQRYTPPASSVALVGALCLQHRELLPVLAEHLHDNDGAVLPHLVMSDVVRWLVEHRDQRTRCQAILSWLESAYAAGDDDERNVIGLSGVDMIPDPGTPGSELRSWLGPVLGAIDPWRPNGGS